MIDFIYNSIEPYTLRALINLFILLLLLMTNFFVWRYCERNNIDHDAVNGASASVSVMYAIFIGFVIFSSVNNITTASEAAKTEASLVTTLAYDASFLSPQSSVHVRLLLGDYLHRVIDQEWPAMRQGQTSNAGLVPLQQLKQYLIQHRPDNTDATSVSMWTDAVQNIDELFQEHQNRLYFSQTLTLSKGIWYCLIIATFVFILANSFFFFEDKRKKYALLFCIAFVTGLLLFLETSINFPYRGYYGVTADNHKVALKQLENNEW